MVVMARADHMELSLAVPLILVSSLCEIALRALLLRSLPEMQGRTFGILATVGNLFYAFCLITDLRVLAAFGRPLDITLYREGTAAMPLATSLSLLTLRDWAFIGLALLTPLRYFFFPAHEVMLNQRRLRTLLPVGALAGMVVIMATILYPASRWNLVPPVVRLPGLMLTTAFLSTPTGLAAVTKKEKVPFSLHRSAPPAVYHDENLTRSQPNILVLVLESTGARYVFDDKLTMPGKGVPMPFLQKLSRESLYFSRHYSSSNSSPRALFSIFTGLYPEVSPDFFSLKRSLKIKTWNGLMQFATQFLVTPCATEWYFPNGLFRNNGVQEIVGKSRLQFSETLTEPADARNEVQSGDYFAARLRQAKEPFFSVYISFAPHYPYHDYGAEWKIAAGERRLDHYVNNLRLLDAQIEKFFAALTARGILKNTLVVIVGDHSEAFYQHKGNYIHSLHSYEENLAVPALIYYPAEVAPRIVTRLTTHADLAPTVLDILHVKHAPREFQGESVLRAENRDYIFAYGNEGTVTAYNEAGIKLQTLKSGSCRTFNLKQDPAEQLAQGCEAYGSMQAAAEEFARRQTPHLTSLQAAMR